MKKEIITIAAFVFLAGTVTSTTVSARGGNGGGDCRYNCGADSVYSGIDEDRSHDERSRDTALKQGCDLDQDFVVNNVCYDGRL